MTLSVPVVVVLCLLVLELLALFISDSDFDLDSGSGSRFLFLGVGVEVPVVLYVLPSLPSLSPLDFRDFLDFFFSVVSPIPDPSVSIVSTSTLISILVLVAKEGLVVISVVGLLVGSFFIGIGDSFVPLLLLLP